MNEEYRFKLSHQGKIIGEIVWLYDAGQQGRSSLEGDAAALEHLQAAMQRAVAERWSGFLLPSQVVVEDPVNWIKEMAIVLEQGGYDVPEVLYPYTPAAQLEYCEKQKRDNRRY